MSYLGNQPALSYTSFAKQDFTTSATTSYTLDNPVTNENELALFINFVRQEAGTAYTASGVNLTLSSATSASDDMYAIFLGKAIQTVNPPNGSVGTAQIADLAVTSGKLASGVLPTNTPNFFVRRTSNISISSNNVSTKITFDTEDYDTDNAYDTSTGKFTPQVAGKYFIIVQVRFADTASSTDIATANIYKNGSNLIGQGVGFDSDYAPYIQTSGIVEMNGSTDYIEGYSYQRLSQIDITGNSGNATFMTGYKIIE